MKIKYADFEYYLVTYANGFGESGNHDNCSSR
jgi:hypothetical protein